MTATTDLTGRQAAVLAAIVRHAATHGGQCPTIRELGEALGITSPNGVMAHLVALEKKGVIVRHDGETAITRGVRVVGLAEALEWAAAAWAKSKGIEL